MPSSMLLGIIVAALVLVTACNDGLDIQQAYPFTVETLPVPKKLKVGETAEIRCQLVRGGDYQPTTYQIRYFQPDGKGKLESEEYQLLLRPFLLATVHEYLYKS